MDCESEYDVDVIEFAVSVYKAEISKQLEIHFDDFIYGMPTVITPEYRDLLKLVKKNQDLEKALELFWSVFSNSPKDHKYKEIYDFGRDHPRLLNILNLNPETEQHRKNDGMWKNIVNKHLKDLKEIPLQGSSILTNLKCLNTITDTSKQRIESILQYDGSIRAIYALVDELPKHHDKWYIHLILVLCKDNFNDIAETLQPNLSGFNLDFTESGISDEEVVERLSEIVLSSSFERSLLMPTDTEEASCKSKLEDKEATVEDASTNENIPRLDAPMDNICGRSSPEGAEDTRTHGLMTSLEHQTPSDTDSNDGVLVLRDYQEELARPGIEGKNSIVFAPTGSGKTIVAVRIALHHMDSSATKRKIAFLVPTKPLADQQAAIFSKYSGKRFRIRDLIGGEGASDNLPLSEILKEYDIVVMTAQVLVNALRSDMYTLESVCCFSMIIFDECHHCDKGHPYNEIMISYFNERKAGRTDLPQIIGLTASFGTNKADKLPKVIEHVLSSCARLDSTAAPKVVDIEDRYLLGWSGSPDDEIFVCNPKLPDYAANGLNKVMSMIEAAIRDIHKRATGSGDDKLSIPMERGSSKYTSFVNGDLKQFRISLSDEQDKKITNMAIIYLNVFNRALILSRLIRSQDAQKYVLKSLIDLTPQTDFEKKVKEKIEEQFIEEFPKEKNPLLEKLRQILTDQFQATADSRVLIFVKEREYVAAIIDWFQDEEPHFDVDFVVGAQASADKGGQTQNRQKAVLSKFRDGQIKILVCTSVLEEGLDVPECNLVIRYSYVTNETAMIQSKGRGRSLDARYIVIVPADESWLQRKEQINKYRSDMMVKATKSVADMDPKEYTEKIQQIQKTEAQARYLKSETQKVIDDAKKRNRYKLLCHHCNVLACYSDEIRKAERAHHLVICDEILDRLKVEETCQMEFAATKFSGSIHCSKCNSKWGPVIYYRDVAFPSIAIKNMIVSLDSSSPSRFIDKGFKKWKSVPFFVEDITMDEITECFNRRKNVWAEARL